MANIDWLDTLTSVTQQTAAVALRHYRNDLTIETKLDGSPVTVADRQAEQAAREWIIRHFPRDAILGEEYGSSGHAPAQRCWLIDPIDGTKSFIRGVPLWGTMLGVMEEGVHVAGAVCCPAVNELVVAARDAGCWHNGSRCMVSRVEELSRATILTTDDTFRANIARRERWQALADRVAVARTWGDCYGYVLVATGRAELMADHRLNLWDYAPLVPIMREAGGVITDWRGGAERFGGDALASNLALADTLRVTLYDRETIADV